MLVINKIDTVEKDALLEVIAAYPGAVVPLTPSSPFPPKPATGWRSCCRSCGNYAVAGPQLFPDDMITDQPERQVMAEIIREKLLWCLEREIPHGTAVEITKFSERDERHHRH